MNLLIFTGVVFGMIGVVVQLLKQLLVRQAEIENAKENDKPN